MKLAAWNKATFGHIFQRKKCNLLCLEGVQCYLAGRIIKSLHKLDQRLKEERHDILIQEELLWQQKSRVYWLKSGHANTSFFHTSTVVRQKE